MEKLIFFTLIFLNIFSLKAQSDELGFDDIVIERNNDNLNLEVVTASKIEQKLSKASGVITVVTSQEIEAYGANTVVDVLNRVTSLYVTGSYLIRRNNAVIRGDVQTHYNTHVLFLINGRPIRESLYAGMDIAIINSFPLELIERIEVLRGPGSVLFGTGAYTGVINIILKDKIKGHVQAKGGSFGSIGTSLSLNHQKKGLNIVSSLQYFSQKGWEFSAIDEKGNYNSTDYGQENMGFFVAMDYKKFTLKGYYGTSAMDFMGAAPQWNPSYGNTAERINTKRGFIDLGYEKKFSDKWNSTLNLTYNSIRNEHFLILSQPTNAIADDFLLEMTHYFQPNDKLSVVAGVNANYVNGVISGFKTDPTTLDIVPVDWALPYSDLRWSVYTQAESQLFPFIKLTAGFQINKIPNVDLDIVPRFGLIINNKKETIVSKLMYGQAFRNPAQLEKGIDILSLLVGDPNLASERVSTYDFQTSYFSKKMVISASLFLSDQEDLIARQTQPDNTAKYINVGSLTSQGGELEFKYNVSEKFSLQGSYAYQENENAEGTKDISHISNDMIKAGLNLKIGKSADIGVFNSYFSKPSDVIVVQPVRQLVNPIPEAFNLLSVNINYRIEGKTNFPDLKCSVYMTNLLDEKVYDPEFSRRNINSIPAMPGRALYASVKLSF